MFGLPEHIISDSLAIFIFGVMGTFVMTVGTLAFDWAWRKVDLQEEIKKGNISSGIVVAAVVIGLALVMASTIKAVTGGN